LTAAEDALFENQPKAGAVNSYCTRIYLIFPPMSLLKNKEVFGFVEKSYFESASAIVLGSLQVEK
jgi:hypothetical protein